MHTEDKTLKALVRSMKSALKREHGLDVPYSALRASLLQARGLNPHSFGKAKADAYADDGVSREDLLELVKEAPTYFTPEHEFEGDKLAWLQRAGLAPFREQARARVASASALHRELYLVRDADGALTRLALDDAGDFWVPVNWKFQDAALVKQRTALLMGARPDYVVEPEEFYGVRFGLPLDPARYHHNLSYLVPDGDGDFDVELLVRMPKQEWNRLLLAVLGNEENELSVREALAEWVGLNHKRNFDAEPPHKQAEWLSRYAGCQEASDTVPETVLVKLEWVWPDEDSDSVPAVLDLETGEVTGQGEVPLDVLHHSVRTRIVVGEAEERYEVEQVLPRSTRAWAVNAKELLYLQIACRELPF